MNMQYDVVEGLANPKAKMPKTKSKPKNKKLDRENISKVIEANTVSMDDGLLVSKYRALYEDIILDLDTNASVFILNSVIREAESISEDMGSAEAQTKITSINNAIQFRTSLNSALTILKNHA
jgi:hypothetical protein